jgi:UDP-N-acetylglucosamine transferase subunit ALG13
MSDEMIEESVEIVIQYGRGKCPLHFLPAEIRSIWSEGDGDVYNDDEGAIKTSIKIQDQGTTKHGTLLIKWYRFKPSLSADMEWADLLLCHAGAGTLLEALSLTQVSISRTTQKTSRTAHRIINAVINSELMNNHQTELAEELEKRNHILVTRRVKEWATISGAQKFWAEVSNFTPTPFVGGSSMSQDKPSSNATASNFQRIVDRVMGI